MAVPADPIGLVRLDYSAEVVQQADLCPARARERPVLRVRDRVTDRVWPCIPDRAVSKPVTDKINSVSAVARTDLVNFAAGGTQKAVLSFSLGHHKAHRRCKARTR